MEFLNLFLFIYFFWGGGLFGVFWYFGFLDFFDFFGFLVDFL